MNKEVYMKPEMEVINLEPEDIIATSGENELPVIPGDGTDTYNLF